MKRPPPKRILIIRMSAIGDIVMASGLIPALRNLWPKAHIAWLVESGTAELLRANPRLDHVIELPRQHWKAMTRQGRRGAAIKEMWAFARNLRHQSFDLVLDLQGLLKSGIWAFATGAPSRIGLGSREGSQWLMSEVMDRNESDPRMGKEYRALAVSLGAADSEFVPDIVVPDASRERAQSHLQQIVGTRRIAVLAPFTTRPQKHWFEARWIALAQALSNRGFHNLILGGPDNAETALRLAEAAGQGSTSLAGKTTLTESAALIEAAEILIGVDTGITHLGRALKTPTVALFGSTLPYWETPTSAGEILYIKEPCSPCHRKPTCRGEFTCMRHLEVDDVLAAVLRLVGA